MIGPGFEPRLEQPINLSNPISYKGQAGGHQVCSMNGVLI